MKFKEGDIVKHNSWSHKFKVMGTITIETNHQRYLTLPFFLDGVYLNKKEDGNYGSATIEYLEENYELDVQYLRRKKLKKINE